MHGNCKEKTKSNEKKDNIFCKMFVILHYFNINHLFIVNTRENNHSKTISFFFCLFWFHSDRAGQCDIYKPVWHLQASVTSTRCCNRVRTEKSIQNSQTFHKPLQYGAKKQHESMQLCRTSGKGVQPLLEPKAGALYQSKLTGNAFSVILHGNFYLNIFFNYCLVLGSAVSD